ncbi:chorismate-binding protein [Cellulomonas timonensis]|uniref:chorismate-binding protein n=1 Tax=Cellulomonas timonensis TaxID=1689271 RepID=UPI0008340AE2|nr:chorismate-binding protein [Cellulomonas timonensis]
MGAAWFAGVRARGVLEHVDVRATPERLATPGFWAVVGDFDGSVRAWRFAEVDRLADGGTGQHVSSGRGWRGPAPEAWSSSMSREQYQGAVTATRAEIRRGRVYQANICRVLSAPLPPVGGAEPDAQALSAVLAAGNPAPYAGGVHVPAGDGGEPVWVVTASPELFLRVDGDVITSAPIKGTAEHPDALQAKDRAENVMITDLVRNDLQRVCEPGTVEVVDLLAVEQHPGLVHLVSTVQGRLLPEVAGSPRLWAEVLDAAYPPASVSGAPKSSALQVISEFERAARGPYCGTVGWIDVAEDGRVRAELAVAIRSFWWTPDAHAGGVLRFGTGAGITWGSDAEGEWAETELKARRLVALASAER